MERPLLTNAIGDARDIHWRCPKRSDPRFLKLAYPGPQDYGTKFPKLIFIPTRSKRIAFYALIVFMVLCVTAWKKPLEQIGLTTYVLLKFSSLPVVSVLFTYAHIWLALYMTFYPTEFVGVPGCQIPESPFGLGWQGIIPSKARKMGKRFINQITATLLPLDEIFSRIDPEILLHELQEPLSEILTDVVQELGHSEIPDLWKITPGFVKEELVIKLEEDLPETVSKLVDRIQSEVNHVFDIEEFVVESIVHNKPLFNHAFIEQGYPEIEFIRDCGGYMGLFFGIVQMLQQYFFPAGWLLPVFGVVVGLFTNWLALKMTFAPVYPVPVCGGRIILQGCFLRRQYQFAPGYANFFVSHVANTRRLVPGIVVGSRSDALCHLIQEELSVGIDRSVQSVQPVMKVAGFKSSYERFKRAAIEKVSQRLPDLFMEASCYVDRAMDLEKTMTERVRAADVYDFEQLLHPIFQEDEWLLILVGGMLGFIVGCTQWYVLGS